PRRRNAPPWCSHWVGCRSLMATRRWCRPWPMRCAAIGLNARSGRPARAESGKASRLGPCPLPPQLVAQNDAQQRAVDPQVAVIVDEAKLPEFVHEVIHPRTRRSDDFGQRLLADRRGDGLRATLLAEIRH